MNKYYWTIDNLKDSLRKLELLMKITTDDEKLKLLQYDYDVLTEEIEEYYIRIKEGKFPLLENYQFVRRELKGTKFLWDDLRTLNEHVEYIKTPKLQRIPLSQSDLLDITHDFYKSLDGFFFKYFMMNFRNRFDHIKFNKKNRFSYEIGTTLTLPSIEESYIEVNRSFTIDDVLTTIHEYSHATSVLINPKHLYTPKLLFSEIDSLFMELIATNYLENSFNYNCSIIRADMQTENCCMADKLIAIFDLIDAEKQLKNGYTSNNILRLVAYQYFKINPFELKKILNPTDLLNIIYLTSFMFALELYEFYIKDKEKALYYLKKIILLRDLEQYEYYIKIKEFGLEPNFSIEKFQKTCEEEILNLTRKKPKL